MVSLPLRSHTVAQQGLLTVALAAAIGSAISGLYLATGQGIPCPWRALTHTLCPFCGSTRLGAFLLRGDLASAWAANQFVFLLVLGLAVAGLFWIVELLGGPAVRLPGRLADQRVWYAVLGFFGVAFAVARNLY